MDVGRVAIIFDDVVRPDTTGVYCRRALERLVDARHFRPSELDRVPRDGFDLYLNIDDGLRYRLPTDMRPCAWWAIDTHLDLPWYLHKAPDFDLVFAAQRNGADALRGAGVDARWLPLACDPDVHRRHDVPAAYDVCFIGNPGGAERQALLELLRRHFPNTLIDRRYFDDMAKAYSAARTVFNRSVRDDVNMRVFEALACGSLLVTNDLTGNGQAELFRDGEHLATYAGPEELLDKLGFYLRAERIRQRVAAAGRREVVARHTYRARMQRVLEEAGRGVRRVTAAAAAAGAAPAHRGPVERPSHAGPSHAGPSPARRPPPDWLDLSPPSARELLDIGCGDGTLGAQLKVRAPLAPVCVTGVERDARAAAPAAGRLDRVLVGDAEVLDLDAPPGGYDAVLCRTSLGRFRNPAHWLRRARRLVAAGAGTLVARLPNAGRLELVASLLNGNLTCGEPGALDAQEIHPFTRDRLHRLFASAGWRAECEGLVYDRDPPDAGFGGGHSGAAWAARLEQLAGGGGGEPPPPGPIATVPRGRPRRPPRPAPAPPVTTWPPPRPWRAGGIWRTG